MVGFASNVTPKFFEVQELGNEGVMVGGIWRRPAVLLLFVEKVEVGSCGGVYWDG